MNKKGNQAVLWMGVVAFVFIIGTFFIIFAKPFDTIFDKLTPALTGESLNSANKVKSLWLLLPVALILVVLIIGLIGALKGTGEQRYF